MINRRKLGVKAEFARRIAARARELEFRPPLEVEHDFDRALREHEP